jgi:predicted DNA-binding WGR domain protein
MRRRPLPSRTSGLSARSPVRRTVILRRVEPDLRMAQFYSLMIEHDLFGEVQLVRAWGRIGTQGSELVQVFATEAEVSEAQRALAGAKRRRGDRDL